MEKMYIPYVFCWPVLQVCTLLPVTGMESLECKIGAKCQWQIWYLDGGNLLYIRNKSGSNIGVQTYNTYQSM
jgi:hypothetical protein